MGCNFLHSSLALIFTTILATCLPTTGAAGAQVLTSETFEHLTQASSGATTGDWLVYFHAAASPQLKIAVDNLARELHEVHDTEQKVVVATVDCLGAGRQLCEQRFGVFDPDEILGIFRRGKLHFKYSRADTTMFVRCNFLCPVNE